MAISYPDSVNLLMLHNTPAHTARKVVWPDNIALWRYLERNPIERVCQDLNGRINVFGDSVSASF